MPWVSNQAIKYLLLCEAIQLFYFVSLGNTVSRLAELLRKFIHLRILKKKEKAGSDKKKKRMGSSLQLTIVFSFLFFPKKETIWGSLIVYSSFIINSTVKDNLIFQNLTPEMIYISRPDPRDVLFCSHGR